MSVITNKIEKDIAEADSFSTLANIAADTAIDNTFGHIQSCFFPKITELPLDVGVNEFIYNLAVISVRSSHGESAFTLLRQICNRFVDEFENISFDPQVITLAICNIVSDRENHMSKQASDLWFEAQKFMETYSLTDVELSDQDHPTPQMLLNTLINGIEEEMRVEELASYAKRVNPSNPVETQLFTEILLSDAIQCAEEMQAIGATYNKPGVPQGKYICSFLQHLINNRGFLTNEASDKTKIMQALQFISAYLRTHFNYSIMITQFFNFLGNDFYTYGEDCITKMSFYFDSCRMYLNTDPAFKFFTENLAAERIPAKLIGDDAKKRYIWIVLQYLDNDLYEGSNMSAMEASSKNEDWSKMEDEEDDEQDKDSEDPKAQPKEEDQTEDSKDEEKKDLGYDIDASQKKDAHHKSSKVVSDGTRAVYKGWKKFESNKQRVEGQINKMVEAGKRLYTGNQVEAIINGNKWTPMQILRTALTSGAIYAFNPIAGICALVLQVALKPRVSRKKRMEFLNQLDDEIRMLDEKIDDARGDGNRQAKYALMRTKNELVNTRNKIQYNLTASRADVKRALGYIKGSKEE